MRWRLQARRVDVAIRHGLGEWPGLVSEHVLDDATFPVCSPRLDNGRLPARPADLSRYTLLRSEGESWKFWFEAAGLDWPEPTRGPMFSDSSHTMQAAIDGQGIALARSSLLGNDVRNGVLVRLFDIVVPFPRKYFLVYPPRLADSPKLAPFRQWLFEEVAARNGGSRPRRNRGRLPRVFDRAKGKRRAVNGSAGEAFAELTGWCLLGRVHGLSAFARTPLSSRLAGRRLGVTDVALSRRKCFRAPCSFRRVLHACIDTSVESSPALSDDCEHGKLRCVGPEPGPVYLRNRSLVLAYFGSADEYACHTRVVLF
jgi:hypothetical protein